MDKLDVTTIRGYLLRGGIWAFIGKIMSALLGLVQSALITRILSPEDNGVFFLALSLSTFFSVFARAGLENTLLRFVSQALGNNQPEYVRDVIRKGFIVAIVSSVIVAAIVYTGSGQWLIEHFFHSSALGAVIGYITVWLVLLAFQFLFDAVFRAYHDIGSAVLFGGLLSAFIVIVFLAFYWLFIGKATLDSVLLAALVAGAANTIIAAWALKRKTDNLPSSTSSSALYSASYREILNHSWPFLFNTIIGFSISSADTWILAAFRTEKEVAIYGTTARLVLLTSITIGVVNVVIPPLIAKLYAQGQKDRLESVLRSTASLAAIPTFLILIMFVLLGDRILGIVFGDYYRAGWPILVLYALGQAISVSVGSCGAVLMMTGKQKILMAISLLSLSISVLVSLSLIRSYGMVGVATGFLFGNIVLQLVSLYFVRRNNQIWTHMYAPSYILKLIKSKGLNWR